MSGEQVAVDAVQLFPIALVVEVRFHSARDDSHLPDLLGVGLLVAGRESALNFGEPLGEQVTVTMDAARVVRKGHSTVELALPRPVDFRDVAKQLGVGIVAAQPGFFREVPHSARGQVAVCAVDHNALPVGVVRGLNPECGGVRVRMTGLGTECVGRSVGHGLVAGESGHQPQQQAASQQPACSSSCHRFLSHG